MIFKTLSRPFPDKNANITLIGTPKIGKYESNMANM